MLCFFPNCPTRAVSFGGTAATLLVTLVCALAPTAVAQQFVVDDAGITDPGACQFEAWLSESAGWLLTACSPISRSELTLGLGFVDELRGGDVHRSVEWAVQAKVNLAEDAPGALAAAIVAGFGFRPFAQASGLPLEGFYAYVPITYPLAGEQALLHGNLGWSVDLDDSEHRLTYGVRSDVHIHHRIAVILELFGEGSDLGAQGGLRLSLVPHLFDIDASYGVALHRDTPEIGPAIGIALTPPPFFRPVGR